VIQTLTVFSALFVIGIAALAIVSLYVLDVSQTKHAIRRNFAVIGRYPEVGPDAAVTGPQTAQVGIPAA
jgi:formate-dependent nitrite reductase membrane component NrfD